MIYVNIYTKAYRVLLGLSNLHDFSRSGKHTFKIRLPYISRFFKILGIKIRIDLDF